MSRDFVTESNKQHCDEMDLNRHASREHFKWLLSIENVYSSAIPVVYVRILNESAILPYIYSPYLSVFLVNERIPVFNFSDRLLTTDTQ